MSVNMSVNMSGNMSGNMSVYMYNKIDIGKIKFDNRPYKKIKSINVVGDDNIVQNIVKSIYYIDINYLGNPLYVQIPCFKLTNIIDDVVELVINNDFYNFIQSLESYIIDIVHDKSETWFLGKKFTMNKIINCLVSNVNRLNDDYYLSLLLSKNISLYDKCKNKISLEKLKAMKSVDIVCIVKITNLQFIDNRFICNLVIEQAKIINEMQIVEYSIIDSENSLDKNSLDKNSVDENYLDENYLDENYLDDEYYKE